MCGIFGYIGNKTNATELAVEGLKSLEYRGYDSWGVAWKQDSVLSVRKEIGKISGIDGKQLSSNCHLVIGHTRWATQ